MPLSQKKAELVESLWEVLSLIDHNEIIVRSYITRTNELLANKVERLQRLDLGFPKGNWNDARSKTGLAVHSGQVLLSPSVLDIYAFPIRFTFCKMSIKTSYRS